VNTRALNALAGVICRAQEQDRTPMGIALAVDSAGLHMSPEMAAELKRLRSRVTELEAERHVTNEALDDAVQALRAMPERLSFAERAARERVPARRAAWRMLAQSVESEQVADALLLTPESGGGS